MSDHDPQLAHIVDDGVVYQVLNKGRTDWDEAKTRELYEAAVSEED
jgi:hypothetical protein